MLCSITYCSNWFLEMVPILVSVLWSLADACAQGVLLVTALYCLPIPLQQGSVPVGSLYSVSLGHGQFSLVVSIARGYRVLSAGTPTDYRNQC